MKKLNAIAITILFATLFATGFAQKNFTGMLVYELSYEGIAPEQAAMMPSSQTMYVSGNKFKMVVDMGMMKMTTISNGDDNSQILLMEDAMGQKLAIPMNAEETSELKKLQQAEDVMPVETGETATIAGYKSKKYLIDGGEGENVHVEVWATDELLMSSKIDLVSNDKLRGLCPTKTITKTDNFTMIATLKEAKQTKVKDVEFLQPAGFQTIDFKTYMQMMQIQAPAEEDDF